MGSSASKSSSNDELVDNLLKDQYLKTPSLQQIFRAVDRGLYFTKENRKHAYDDTAWRSGNIHLSAPGIYCDVLENLELGEGMSFLNLGSGTGYLNTMAGLIIGSYGINYGVEFHKDVIEYAYNRLEKFKWTAEAIDEYDFCEPKFFEGNCLQLSSENKLYDRVYCGAACPPAYENYMKNLIKIHGILVMPLEEVLVKVTRTSETSWVMRSIIPVNFANMIPPSTCDCDANKPQLLLSNPEPLSLQVMCRRSIRQLLLKVIRVENPKLKYHRIRKGLGTDNHIELMCAAKKHCPSFFSWVPDNDNENDDDNSSVERDEMETYGMVLHESDEDMERNEEETDGEERESDDDDNTPKKVKGEPSESGPSLLSLIASLERKNTSSSDSGADVEDMDVEMQASQASQASQTSQASNEANKKTEKSSDGAGCSSNVNIGSFSESDEEDDDSISQLRRSMVREMVRKRIAMMAMSRGSRLRSLGPDMFQDGDCDGDGDDKPEFAEPPTVSPSYSILMREKIRSLPLPPTIQAYLNFHRTF